MQTTDLALQWVEQGRVPDSLVRKGIRRLLRKRLEEIDGRDAAKALERKNAFSQALTESPVALVPELANAQHYELPPAFFEACLGPRGKYSCCHWGPRETSLARAEASALEITCQRAGLDNRQRILELGCGWGSLSLWVALHYPLSHITAVSNSRAQRDFILARAAHLGLDNLEVITADMNDFQPQSRYDRVVSVEMFEHLRNWPEMFGRVARWLKPGGQFFMHVFCHRDSPYLFEDRGEDDWMSRHFFSGGMMPSDDLAPRLCHPLRLVQQWRWNGRHYEKTCNAWLAQMDARRDRIMPLLRETYGEDQAAVWWTRWRLFYMACAETFGYDGGNTWWVSHYLFQKEEIR
ncbi:MAG: cyclopropane-fatty-acyl-phospholipid synthase family protein [Pseudomonadota bacterium]